MIRSRDTAGGMGIASFTGSLLPRQRFTVSGNRDNPETPDMADLHDSITWLLPHPLGVSSFSFSIQNVWEMTIVVDKIACRSYTVCPPPMVLRLFIVDTIGFTTVYS